MTSTFDQVTPLLSSDRRPTLEELEQEVQQLRAALERRVIIGQAMGILMTRLDVDAEVAFSYLRRRSMHENRKLVDIAKDIARIRHITTCPRSRETGA